MNKVDIKTEETRAEKIFYKIVVLLGIVAILIIVLVNVPWGGDKTKIKKEYEYLEKDHVYISIKVDEVKERLESKESFHLYIGNNDITDSGYFVYYANQLAEKYNIKEIYYLNNEKLNDDDILFLKENTISSLSMDTPNLIYFEEGSAKRISSAEDFDEFYGSNYWLLLEDYFENCNK